MYIEDDMEIYTIDELKEEAIQLRKKRKAIEKKQTIESINLFKGRYNLLVQNYQTLKKDCNNLYLDLDIAEVHNVLFDSAFAVDNFFEEHGDTVFNPKNKLADIIYYYYISAFKNVDTLYLRLQQALLRYNKMMFERKTKSVEMLFPSVYYLAKKKALVESGVIYEYNCIKVYYDKIKNFDVIKKLKSLIANYTYNIGYLRLVENGSINYSAIDQYSNELYYLISKYGLLEENDIDKEIAVESIVFTSLRNYTDNVQRKRSNK